VSNGNINVNLNNWPESPLFWLLVAIAGFLVLLATGHAATAVVLFFAAIAVICLVINLTADSPSPALWWACGICAGIALILGLAFVPDDWRTPDTDTALARSLVARTLLR